jgi:hypothetical protein
MCRSYKTIIRGYTLLKEKLTINVCVNISAVYLYDRHCPRSLRSIHISKIRIESHQVQQCF